MTIDRTKIRWNGWGWAAHKDELAGREDVWAWLAGELGMPALLATPARPLESITLPATRLPAEAQARFVALLGADRVRDDAYERAFHARGKSYHDLLRLRAGDLSVAPDAVLYPRSGEEVLGVLAAASEFGVAVVPYGGGTSVVGGVSAAAGSFKSVLTLDLSGMDRLIDIDASSRTATAEAGIYGPALEKALQAKGFTLGHHPQSFEFSTLGGWIAHRGAGQGSGRYGRAEDWLVGAKLATPRGLLSVGGFSGLVGGAATARPGAGLGRRVRRRDRSDGAAACAARGQRLSRLSVPRFRRAARRRSAKRCRRASDVTMLRLSDAAETRFYRAFGALGKKRGIGDRLAQIYLDSRGFDDKACAMIAGFEGDAATTWRGRAARSTRSPRNIARCSWAKARASAGRTDASTDPICAIR